MELDPSVVGGEAPSDGCVLVLGEPVVRDASQRWNVGNALIECLPGKDGEKNLGHIEPASMLRGEVELEALCETPSFHRLEGFVKGSERVRTEIVHDEDDVERRRVDVVREMPKEVGKVDGRATLRHLKDDATFERFDGEKDVCRTAAPIFVINASSDAAARRNRLTHMLEQLLACLVQANLGKTRVIRAVVDVEDVLHRVHECRVLRGRDAESFDAPRFELVFFPTADGRW